MSHAAFLQWTANRSTPSGGRYGEQVEDQGERSRAQRDREPRYASPVRPAQRAPPAWAALWLRSRAVWCLLGAVGREGDPELCDAGRGGFGESENEPRGAARFIGAGEG